MLQPDFDPAHRSSHLPLQILAQFDLTNVMASSIERERNRELEI